MSAALFASPPSSDAGVWDDRDGGQSEQYGTPCYSISSDAFCLSRHSVVLIGVAMHILTSSIPHTSYPHY
jgi:hypothetical protein